ncbi:hypothetical protein [uncultured Parasphingorhabdus sp.]|uniref:hypothetical protein n=1 Tax=uncultured Parasphingorhabdus sp. TaxID=2709694 RepID=UPI00374892EB
MKMDKATKYVKDLPGFKRTNPQYFSDQMIDKILEVIILMGGEIWTLRHRQAITEKLMASGRPVSADMIETFESDESFRDQMEVERQDLIRRMFASLAAGEFPDPREAGFNWAANPQAAGNDQQEK